MKKADVTRKVDWEQKYKEMQKRQVLLRRMTKELLSTNELPQSLKKIAAFLIPYLGDFCNISIINEKDEVERIDSYHLNKRKTWLIKRITKLFAKYAPPVGTLHTIRTSKPEFRPDNTQTIQMFKEKYPEIYPLAVELDAKAYITVPIIGSKKTIGVIALASVTRHYTEDDFEFAQLIAERIALVIENTRLYTDTQKKIIEYTNREMKMIKDSEEKWSFLAKGSKILASSLDFQTTLKNVANLAVPEIADWCMMDLKDESGNILDPVVVHIDPKKRALGYLWRKKYTSTSSLKKEAFTASVIRTGKPVYIPFLSDELYASFAKNKKQLAIMKELDFRSLIIMPLIVGGSTFGSITFGTSGNRPRYKKSDVPLFEELASRASVAIENAKLHQRAQRAISLLKESEKKWSFLANASKILASSLDFQTTLTNVANLAVPDIADWCIIDLLDEDGNMRDPMVVHTDPKKVALGYEYRKKFAPNIIKEEHVMSVISSGKPTIIPLIDEKFIVNYAATKDQVAVLKAMDFTSIIIAPILVRGRAIGSITFGTSGSRPRYDKTDLAMVEELASRASSAMENSRLHQKAQRAITIRNDFMSIASHELKTPITSIKMYGQFLKKIYENLPDKSVLDYFEKMDEQVDKMSALISDLLDISRIEHGKFHITMGKFSLDDEVKDAVQVCQAMTEKHKIRIEGNIGKEVRGDRERISQVLINLLNNAIKYSPDANDIIVKIANHKDRAYVGIQDFGIGIDKEDQRKLFQPFFRSMGVEKEAKTTPGLGIGLYVSSEIIQKHGGKITVESEKGKGSTFSFTLPHA